MVNISSFVRDMGIGALAQVETNRAATAKRAEDRETQEAERKKRLGEIKLQAELSAEQNRETIEGRAKQAGLDRESKERLEKAKQTTANLEAFDDHGLKVATGITLPFNRQYEIALKKDFPENSTKAIEHRIVHFNDTIKSLMNSDIADHKRISNTPIFKAYVRDHLKKYITSHGLWRDLPSGISGATYQSQFDFQSGASTLYNLLKDDNEMLGMMKGPSNDPHGARNADDVASLKNSPNSITAQRLLADGSTAHFREMLARIANLGGIEQFDPLVRAMLGTSDDKKTLIELQKNKPTIKSLNYNPFDPYDHLNTIADAANLSVGSGYIRQAGVGGTKPKHRPPGKAVDDRIKASREKLSEAGGLLRSVLDLNNTAATLDEAGTPSLGVLQSLATVVTSVTRALSPTNLLGDPQIIGFNETNNTLKMSKEQSSMLNYNGDMGPGLKFNKYFEDLKKLSEKRIGSYKGAKDTKEYAAMVQWEALTIQLVYKVAKMVQGGSGGQAVSNADFQAVLSSFQRGALGSREGTVHVLKMTQRMVEREYVHHKTMSNPNVIKGSQRAADNAVRFFDLYHPRPLIGGGTEQTSGTTQTGSTQLHSDGFPFEGTDAWYALNASVRVRILEKRNAPS